ncbi:MAG: hypothetical protein ACT4PI_10235 [Actinomycetota bacterium]
MRIRSVVRLALPVVVLLAFLAAACTPVKPQVVPGRSIAYYYVQEDPLSLGPEFRSLTPFTQPVNGGAGAASQTLNSNGTVNLAISNAGCPCGAFTGFYTPLFRLGDLVNARVVLAPGSSPVLLNLVIDQSGNGEWGEWDANGMSTGFGGDERAIGPFTAGGQVEINDSREFTLDQAGGPPTTLGELKAGVEPGIDANTRVGLQVVAFTEFSLFFAGDDANSVVASLVLNNVQILP